MIEVDIVIVGAGVIGLACGMELSKTGKSVVLVEKWPNFGEEVSSRNSEVIHAGIYYKPNSLKAKLCVNGNFSIYEHAEKYKIPHKKCGKYIVATNENQLKKLDEIFENANNIGARDLEIISGSEVSKNEPNVFAISAIYSPSSGIIDTHSLMQSFEAISLKNGIDIFYNHKLIEIEKDKKWNLTLENQDSEKFVISSEFLVNCAGLDADLIAKLAGIDIRKYKYEHNFALGRYFKLSPKFNGFTKRLIYPIPEQNTSGLGIHLTPDLTSAMKLGPDVYFSNNREKDYDVDESLRPKFYASASKYLKNFTEDDIYPDYSGIRPKLQKEGENPRDFIIQEESGKSLNGLVNLIGIESPGLTSSIEISKMVTKIILESS